MNEDKIRNLLSPGHAITQEYYSQRHAEAQYRIVSPWLGLALTVLSSALILRGQLRRDLWSKRAFANVSASVLVIICMVIARGWTVSNPSLWPFIYLSVLVPIGIASWLLISPKTSKVMTHP
jgi:lipopolysaccharide export LptBFGC system permease protein LptF